MPMKLQMERTILSRVSYHNLNFALNQRDNLFVLAGSGAFSDGTYEIMQT